MVNFSNSYGKILLINLLFRAKKKERDIILSLLTFIHILVPDMGTFCGLPYIFSTYYI